MWRGPHRRLRFGEVQMGIRPRRGGRGMWASPRSGRACLCGFENLLRKPHGFKGAAREAGGQGEPWPARPRAFPGSKAGGGGGTKNKKTPGVFFLVCPICLAILKSDLQPPECFGLGWGRGQNKKNLFSNGGSPHHLPVRFFFFSIGVVGPRAILPGAATRGRADPMRLRTPNLSGRSNVGKRTGRSRRRPGDAEGR